MTDERAQELAGWLRLAQAPGVGLETARKLLGAFGLPANIFSADLPTLRNVVSERVAHALHAPPSVEMQAQIDRTIAWAQLDGNHLMTLADAGYPLRLLDTEDPPLLLYAKGRVDLLSASALAVVGSRNATTQGTINAEKFSESLSSAGLTIVSGMALGIDAAAHRGGLRGAGSTVAVIGTGADIVYPARNRALAHEIAAAGCIVSEYPLGMPGIAANFPRRNRIISGLARGVLVVEAAARSGSLITARLAADQGREVFAIPGSIHSPLSKGCHQLIKQGAKLAESAQDILEELGDYKTMTSSASVVSDINRHAHDPILTAMSFDPVDIDSLALRCKTDAASLNARLLALELEGLIELLPGGMYRRVERM